jgi:hypothetical protein
MKYAIQMGSGAIHTNFHIEWFWHSKADMGGITSKAI